jgi:hypothetical protein
MTSAASSISSQRSGWRPWGRFVVSVLAVGALSLAPVPLLSGGTALASPAEPTYTDIAVPGALATYVTGLNDLGVLSGYYLDAAGQHGFLDDHGTVVTVDVPGSVEVALTSVNNAGTATGTYWEAGGLTQHGFLRDADGTLTLLDAPAAPDGVPGHPWGTVPSQVNSSGTVVGWYFSTVPDGFSYPDGGLADRTSGHGFVWQGGTFTTFDAPGSTTGDLPWSGTRLLGISSTGDMTGTASWLDGSEPSKGFVVSGSTVTTFTDPTVPTNFCGYTVPSGIDALGEVVGSSGNGCAPTQRTWLRRDGELVPFAYPGATTTDLSSINDLGYVAGTWIAGNGEVHGFVSDAFAHATVSGTVALVQPAPVGTTTGVLACPAEQSFSASCPGGRSAATDASGSYALTLTRGTWNVAAFVLPGGDPAQRVSATPVAVGLDPEQVVTQDFLLTAPSGTVTGTVKADGPFYPGTLLGARACPAGEPFGPACPLSTTATTDPAGHYRLTLSPGAWNVAGSAWQGGDPAQETATAPVAVTLVQGQSVTRSFVVASPSGSVKGTVKPNGPFPAGTTYGAWACPSTGPFGPTCPEGLGVGVDASWRYSLTLPPGDWLVAGLARVGGTSPVLASATRQVTVVAGQSTNAAFTVVSPYGAVSGTVRTDGPVPAGTTYSALACPNGQPVTPTCTGGSVVTANASGGYTLVLSPGSWSVEGIVRPGGTSLVLTSSPAGVGVSVGRTASFSPTVPVPFGAAIVTPRPSGPFPAGTTFGALACPSGQAFVLSCSGGSVAAVDGSGRATLALLPGTWNVAALAWLGGSGATVVGTPVPMTVTRGRASSAALSVTSPYGAVTGTVSADGPFPAGTSYGVVACPGSEPFGSSCSGLATASADASGRYALVLGPGAWNVAGFASVSGQRVSTGPVTVPVTAGLSTSQSFQVPSPFGAVSGTVKPGGQFPYGTTYGVLACPSGQPLVGSCSSAAFASANGKGGYLLTLTPGSWQVAGAAWPGGGSPAVLTAATTLTVVARQTVPVSFVVLAPTYLSLNVPRDGAVGVPVSLSAVLYGIAGNPVAGATVSFALGSVSCSGNTDRTGRATCALAPQGPARADTLTVAFVGDTRYAASSASSPFTVH